MKKELIYNIILSIWITFIISIFSFVVNKEFINNMGITNLGLMKLFSQIIGYLTLLDMGLSSAATYYFYKPLSEKNWDEVSNIYTTIRNFYNKIALLIFILGIICSPLVIYISGEFGKEIYLYWILYVLNSALSYFLIKYSTIFLADQKYKLVKIIDGLGTIGEKIIQLYIVIKFKSFSLFIIVTTVFFFIKFFYYKKYLNKYYPKIKTTSKININVIKTAKQAFFHKLSYMVIYNTDYIIIAKCISLKMVGIYSSYLMIYNLVMTAFGIIHGVIDSKLGKILSLNSNEKNLNIWKIMFRISCMCGLNCVIIFYFMVNDFIILWLGREYILENITVLIIAINLFIDIIKWPIELFKYKYGYVKDIYTPILESFLNFFISIILVNKIGIIGVLIGTLSSNILIILLLKSILVFKNCFIKNLIIYIKELIINLIYAIFICILMNIFSKKVLTFQIVNWNDLMLKLLIITMMSTIITIMVFNLRKEIRKNIVMILKKNKEEIQ